MREGKSSKKANRIKKKERMESKKDLKSFYIKVARKPKEKGLKTYTKIVDLETADKLINGVSTVLNGIVTHKKKLSRNFKQVS